MDLTTPVEISRILTEGEERGDDHTQTQTPAQSKSRLTSTLPSL